ncbi:transmembrane protein 243 isoform X1 [Marmota monax]|uniref:transmembrane protein 243 isoform X1 n=1 Tax=Marmota flaviventris TaxID=93162 RepID=UPI000FFFBB4C|nr:transmembrane protein 243 isoform X1 [Marmota flaviventris]XP_046318424.1 transmembrane protein 243 isoform X1 [Marmota monax]XP_048641422.1 transmembrane protein 243 isoform X1 [Marmota marmota marmota]
MEDFPTRTYGTSGLDNRPLFGETSAKDRIINLVVGSLTSLLILVTLISAFVFPQLPPKPLNIFFAVCISLSSITACILMKMSSCLVLCAKSRVPGYGKTLLCAKRATNNHLPHSDHHGLRHLAL